YGFPNRSTFSARSETYYVNPKAGPVVCFAKPSTHHPNSVQNGPASMWDPAKGFLTRSTDPSSYGLNFPTTGLNGLYFDLLITGSSQPLFWSPVSQGGITATMSNPTATSVRVTLTGPYATESQRNSSSPSPISKPTLPQTFELVGRDNNGTPVVKYGFTLKQWFVNRGSKLDNYANTLSWCNRIGYRVPSVRDLTNSSCRGFNSGPWCQGSVGATPSSPNNLYMRHIGSGFVTEWGELSDYSGVGFHYVWYWTSDPTGSLQFLVNTDDGYVSWNYTYGVHYGLCSHP
ncbi:hypothetical protein J3U16_08130, partial [Gilliamella sp. B3023]|uniref:hypothetical protein n=1 Tax=Gilliamella sp. B3023 TaxID=2817987 RepID=UPI00226A1C26